ncbi:MULTISPECIES: CPBP family intramembrane glutamic endopeptidase [unclassified Parvimonas]|uniref:CPBP family intramembrane glutamic endopeptidase n=1 Tax=unclassified Parvimonas TaxID=1151464 RepID=UPI002B45B5E1|nr:MULTISPECIES: CPBP family intramembrane glutamic endopeptidase [unclassified Parvimonas]MEB3024719.1 CPBP family intramembrane glutamic endopeptidase [Parvimonas sp. M13]MEB3088864.1 CPBP family intramembrane glutamic endopeptidase [Parvimonas sp. M20]
MKNKYIKSNIFPIFIELLFVVSCFIVEKQFYIYTNFFFYLLLAIYFYIRKDFSIKEWYNAIKSGKKFFIQVILTVVFISIAFYFTIILENIFPNLSKGMILLRADNWLKLILFLFSVIIFPPIIEETFFRQNLISFKNNKILIFTTFLSMFLYALEHSLRLWGIFLCMIWALPFSVSYIKTRNIYVPMTAHLICNLIINGVLIIDVIKYIFN